MIGQTGSFTSLRLFDPLPHPPYLPVFSKPRCSLSLCSFDSPLPCHTPVPSGFLQCLASSLLSLYPASGFPAFRPPQSSNGCCIFSSTGQFQHPSIRLVTGPTGSYLQKHHGPDVPVVLGKKLLKESPRLRLRWTSCWLVKRSQVEQLLGQPYLAYVL